MDLNLVLYLHALLSNSSFALMEHLMREVVTFRDNDRFFGRLFNLMIFFIPLKLKVRVFNGVLGDFGSLPLISSSSKGFVPGVEGVAGTEVSHSTSSNINSNCPFALD